jgi:heme-degrading monooxygenase HmoA
LWQILTELEGFISLERYKSVSDPDKIMAIGFFESEDAVRAWRNMPEHRQAQRLGREVFFTDYRLRMAQVTRDYGLHDREQIPDDSRAFHDAPISE